MPTKNPRLSITFEPAFIARLRRLSELTGNSQGALAAELLEGCIPAIDRLIKLLEAARSAKDDVAAKLVADLAEAHSRVEVQLGLALADADAITDGLLAEAEKVQRRGARRTTRMRGASGSPAVSTPISNRGVRSINNSSRTKP